MENNDNLKLFFSFTVCARMSVMAPENVSDSLEKFPCLCVCECDELFGGPGGIGAGK